MSQQDDLDRPDETSEPSQDVEMFLYACLFELGIGVLGMLVGWLIGVDVRAYLPRLDSLEVAVLAKQIAVGVVAAIPMLLMVRMVMMVDHPAISEIKNVGESSMMAGLLKLTGPELLVISLCAGVGEELAFRGCLLPAFIQLTDYLVGSQTPYQVGGGFAGASPFAVGLAVAVSSLAFGAVHAITRLYAVMATLMGVVFGLLMVFSDSLIVPIVAHAVFDAVQFLQARRELKAEDGQAASE
ncbi:CAAX amino terminal protease self- immunity [Stieleria bergensis]|uniref:CAAX amino terminal protease self-immunity n=1 Tax=Stieleria bergensis TaxID=2528025 RepID=A0A517T100_9BACT|nr:CAAX amino terminal protease self- immunity [Planctomycetes bacterium SV_7m_r]